MVFCLFAEDAGLFGKDAFVSYLRQVTPELRDLLLEEAAAGTDWPQISPTISGVVFEATLNPQARRAGGMHYTSSETIHRVIDPLFLDDLKAELNQILTDPALSERRRMNALRRYQKKLGSLGVLIVLYLNRCRCRACQPALCGRVLLATGQISGSDRRLV